MHSQGVCRDLRLRWSPYPVKDSLRSQHHWFSWEAHALAFSLAVVLGILYWSLPSSPSLACLEPLEDLTESLSWTALGGTVEACIDLPQAPCWPHQLPLPFKPAGQVHDGWKWKKPGLLHHLLLAPQGPGHPFANNPFDNQPCVMPGHWLSEALTVLNCTSPACH